MVEAADHLGHDCHDLGMGVPEDGAHLATREVEDPPPGRVLDERTRGPLGYERHERRAIAHEMTIRSLEVELRRTSAHHRARRVSLTVARRDRGR